MQTSTNRTAAIAIVILLLASIGTTLTFTADAHTPPYQIKTYAGVSVQPPIIGVGQSALVYLFLKQNPISGATESNTLRNHNYTCYITSPSGNMSTFYYETVKDTTGVQFFRFTPTEVGNYNVTFFFGGNVLNSTWFDTTSSVSVGDWWMPSSDTTTLTVLQDPIATYPDSYPLPTEYWTRPIYGENSYWWSVSSNWFGIGSPCLSDVSFGTMSSVPSGQSGIQRYPGDAVGSLTSHVMWTKPLQEGGVVGDNRLAVAGDTYFEGSAYNNRYTNPIIMYGRLFYREPIALTGPNSGDSVCVDLRTGQEIWRRDDLPTMSFGYYWDVQSVNQHGVYPAWLCTSNFARIFDMWTGENIVNVTGSASGFLVSGPVGEYLKYNIFSNGTTGYFLSVWNSSKMFTGTGYVSGSGNTLGFDTTNTPTTTWAWQNRTVYEGNVPHIESVNVTTTTTTTAIIAAQGKRYETLNWTMDGNARAQNISLPWRNTMSGSPTVLAVKYNDYMLCINGSRSSNSGVTANSSSGTIYTTSANWTYFKVNLNATNGELGKVLWWSPTITHKNDETLTFGGFDPTAQVVTEVSRETQNIWGYSTKDSDAGRLLWQTNEVNSLQQQNITSLDYFGNPYFPYYSTQTAYGNIYGLAYGGVLYCYNLTTGVRTWVNGNGHTPGNNTDTGLSVPGYIPQYIQAVGNGAIYSVATQHTVITPLSKGQTSRAVDAFTGEEIWSISDYTGSFNTFSYAMADGYSNWFNGYDNQIYTVGRGPSTMTVSAPNLAAASGQPVVISGSVYDVSSGASQNEQAARFAQGLPCAADSIMSEWMGYVYQQKPLPANFTGVNVDLYILDSNDNYRTVQATTDSKGNYNVVWTPDISGTYKVTASFAGTKGYWPSSDTAVFTVMEPAVTASPVPTQPPSTVEQYFIPAIAGLFVFIAIVLVVMVLMMRKRA